MAVKVILQQDVPNLGSAGEVKQVAPGYFRNFLLPRGLALEASKGNLSSLTSTKSVQSAQVSRARGQANALAQQLSAVMLSIPVRLGDQGRIHGSVTNKDIADALTSQANISIDRHKIDLRDPLKSIGQHTVSIRLDHGAEAAVKVDLVPDGEAPAT